MAQREKDVENDAGFKPHQQSPDDAIESAPLRLRQAATGTPQKQVQRPSLLMGMNLFRYGAERVQLWIIGIAALMQRRVLPIGRCVSLARHERLRHLAKALNEQIPAMRRLGPGATFPETSRHTASPRPCSHLRP